ncbi:MAG: hypothetical protein GYB68_16280 [Chloroflexi bacterium]|nr:hypothetical protein [Chloroflexota bacterium]
MTSHTARWTVGLVLVLAALACNAPALRNDGPPTPQDATPSALLSPSPDPIETLPVSGAALNGAEFWVAAEGATEAILSVALDGSTQRLPVPLNPGQQASRLVASQDGSWLAFIVSDADGSQRGAATWNVNELNARLIAPAQEGFRVVSLMIAGDNSALALVSVEDGVPIDEADWFLLSLPIDGGGVQVLASRDSLAEEGVEVPPTLFAWPGDERQLGPILLNAESPDGSSAGIFAVLPPQPLDEGGFSEPFVRRIAAPDERISAPRLSPNGAQFVYLSLNDSDPTLPDDLPTNIARVYDLRLDEAITLQPPQGTAIFGARWLPTGDRLVLDIVRLPSAEQIDETIEQGWVVVDPANLEGWQPSFIGPQRDRLFDYEAFGPQGVAYTVFPDNESWLMVILPDVFTDDIVTVSLAAIAAPDGTPIIVHVP